MPTRKYNPGFLTDDELAATFCVRTNEFESITETLCENTGNSNQHVIVIGPRGSGKTSLLLRAAVEVRRNRDLSSRLFPITFAEESYEVGTCGEFWLECLDRLAWQAPEAESKANLRRTWEDLRAVTDDQALAEHCLGALLDFSDHMRKRLVLLVENLNMMLGDMVDRDAGWRLRKTLQTEPRIILLGSATSRFDEIDRPDQALYDLFRVITLRPLDTTECGVLWMSISGETSPEGKIRSLEILTGGSPRLIAIVARFGAGRPFHELMDDLLELIDEHTEYFKNHLDSLPHQERRIYLALADLWKPATTREIADRARLASSTCSAQLKRLIYRGVVTDAGGTIRRKQYYLAERLYNIYYLLRRGGADGVVRALIRFMASWYSHTELVERILGEATESDKRDQSIYQHTLTQLSALPEMRKYRRALLATARSLANSLPRAAAADETVISLSRESPKCPERTAGQARTSTKISAEVRGLTAELEEHFKRSQYRSAIAICDRIIALAGPDTGDALRSAAALALVNKGMILGQMDRSEEAAAVYDEVVTRFEQSDVPDVLVAVATALLNKGVRLGLLNRHTEELKVYADVSKRFRDNHMPAISERVAMAMLNTAITLDRLCRSAEALDACDAVVSKYGASDVPGIGAQVVLALSNKSAMLVRLGRPEEALATFDDIAHRFDGHTIVKDAVVVEALVNKGIMLVRLNRLPDALEAYEDVIRRYSNCDMPDVAPHLAKSMMNKAVILTLLKQVPDAFEVYDDVMARFAESDIPGVVEQVAGALMNKSLTLINMKRFREANTTCDEVVERFGAWKDNSIARQVAAALVSKGVALTQMNRWTEAAKVSDEVVRRFGDSDVVEIVEQVSGAILNKGVVLSKIERWEDALASFDEVIERYGTIQTSQLCSQVAIAVANRGLILVKLMRSKGRFRELIEQFGSVSSCERDLSVTLVIISQVSEMPAFLIQAALLFCARIGPERAMELIQEQPEGQTLLALATALQQELGYKPRVAQEVAEVAQDIRKELEKLRTLVSKLDN